MFQRPAAVASAAFRLASSFSSTSTSSQNINNNHNNNKNQYARSLVQWYPGHIAKAERLLRDTLKLVDVVVEVRDARACVATCHPQVPLWCAGRPRVVVLTHIDAVPTKCQRAWQAYYEQEYSKNDNNNDEGIVVDEELRGILDQDDDDDDSSQQQQQQQQQRQQQHNLLYKQLYTSPVTSVLFVNAKEGQGIHALQRAIIKAGARVQQKRWAKGLKPRALRVAIIGYPNVGKSALINKLLGKRRLKTANTPGVTRSLQWIRINSGMDKNNDKKRILKKNVKNGQQQQQPQEDMELLDSPGIIPASLEDQSDALLLAACNCIGQASYDNQAVAAYLVDYLQALYQASPQACPDWPRTCQERYGVNPMTMITKQPLHYDDDVTTLRPPQKKKKQRPHEEQLLMTGEDFLYQVADLTCQGDPEDASRKILQDFRNGRMGLVCLQILSSSSSSSSSSSRKQKSMVTPLVDANTTDVNANATTIATATTRPSILEPLPKLYQSGGDPVASEEDLARVQQAKEKWDEERRRRAQLAQKVAQEQGLELPPLVLQQQQQQQPTPIGGSRSSSSSSSSSSDGPDTVEKERPPQASTTNNARSSSANSGKGLFEGW